MKMSVATVMIQFVDPKQVMNFYPEDIENLHQKIKLQSQTRAEILKLKFFHSELPLRQRT